MMHLVVLGHHHHAGRIPVQPMDDARSQAATSVAERIEVKLQRGSQRAGRLSATGMHNHVGRLVDRHEVFILVEHAQRQVLGLNPTRGLGWQRQFHDIINPQSPRRLDR